jgi:hypothetical protein
MRRRMMNDREADIPHPQDNVVLGLISDEIFLQDRFRGSTTDTPRPGECDFSRHELASWNQGHSFNSWLGGRGRRAV